MLRPTGAGLGDQAKCRREEAVLTKRSCQVNESTEKILPTFALMFPDLGHDSPILAW